jgi:DNA polymerase III epsilon subunit-like protein
MIYLLFDTETTGLPLHPSAKKHLQPRIIEFAAILCDVEGNQVSEYSQLIDPGFPVSDEITKITGITNEDLGGKPAFADVVPEIEALFRLADVLVAHNLPFDKTLLEIELELCGRKEDWPWPRKEVCTVQEFSEEFGYRPKLTLLWEFLEGSVLDQTHRALDDVSALKRLCMTGGVLTSYAE